MELDELKKIVDVTLKKLEDEGVVKKSIAEVFVKNIK